VNRSAPHFGMTGLATMGANLARNMAHHAIPVAVHNRTTAKTERFMTEHGTEGPLSGHASIEEWVGALEHPRVAMIMVSAGAAVDAVIDKVAPHLDDGDVVVDGGNSLFSDTQRRGAELAGRGIRFMGVGISGGEQGALEGPSIMAGGPRDAYDEIVGPVLEAIAARVGSTPCAAWLGSDGAGHYVKMVHNGIEYADMQLIAESYDLLRNGAGLEVGEIAQRFNAWEHGKLESFLIESTARVLARTDAATAKPLVDVVLDAAEQKGTGRWTAQDALELGVALPTITEAVFARAISSSKAQRVRSGATLAGPSGAGADERLGDDIEHALYASKIVAYAQGFAQMAAASEKHGWDLELAAVATIWRGGCIIRARFLDDICDAFGAEADLRNLMLADFFCKALAEAQEPWRRVVARSAELGIPAPAFSSSLAYYDGLRRATGPSGLIQALRDLFGAHTYRRVDRKGTFHIDWSGDAEELQVGD